MKSIMIVDDDIETIELLSQIVSALGYKFILALSGEEALVKIEDVIPDLILLDIMMPTMNGVEFCKKIGRKPETAKIPVIMVSAKHERGVIDDVQEAGAKDYVLKPFIVEELATTFVKYLGNE